MERRSWPWRSKKTIHKVPTAKTTCTSPSSSAAALDSSPTHLNIASLSPNNKRSKHFTVKDELLSLPQRHHHLQQAIAPQTQAVQHQELINASVLVEEAISQRGQAEEKVKALCEKLDSALGDVSAKEDLVKQHSKVAEEAISGWENAEAEAATLKKELEESMQQRMMVEAKAAQLDGALKECMKQVRLAREEQEIMVEEAVKRKTQEWERVKADMDAKRAELTHRLLERDAESSVMVKSLQERAHSLSEMQHSRGKAEGEVRVLEVKVDSLEKEVSALKYELHVLSKELDIRTEEREFNKKASDAAHKQHLENVRKIAKLEAECQRLRGLVKKKLPGPAAVAQMRMEVEGLGRDHHQQGKIVRRRSLSSSYTNGTKGGINAASSLDQAEMQGIINRNHAHQQSEMEMLTERMAVMEEETKLLKESLSKRDAELQASRQFCAKTVNKLVSNCNLIDENDQYSCVSTPRRGIKGAARYNSNFSCPTNDCNSTDIDAQSELSVSVTCASDQNGTANPHDDAEEAESWASALITELENFSSAKKSKRGNAQSIDATCCVNLATAMDNAATASSDVAEEATVIGFSTSPNIVISQEEVEEKMDAKSSSDQDVQLGVTIDLSQSPSMVMDTGLYAKDRRTLAIVASKEAQLQAANLMCKDVYSKLAMMEDKLRQSILMKSSRQYASGDSNVGIDDDQIMLSHLEESLKGAMQAYEVMGKLDRVLDEMRIAVASLEDTDEEQDTQIARENPISDAEFKGIHPKAINPVYVDNLGFVFCKLIILLEMVSKMSCVVPSSPLAQAITTSAPDSAALVDCGTYMQQTKDIINAKDRFLQGKASVMEFLLRFAVGLSELCRSDSGELEGLLAKEAQAPNYYIICTSRLLDELSDQQINVIHADVGHAAPGILDGAYVDGITKEVERVKEEKAEMEKQLCTAHKELKETKDTLAQCVASTEALHGEIRGLQEGEKRLIADMEGEKKEVDAQMEKSKVEVSKLQKSVASLTVELADRKQAYEEAIAKCDALEQKLKGFVEKEHSNSSSFRFAEGEDARTRQVQEQEREVAAAKEKLAECQRTIFVLGKQLTALTSPPAGHQISHSRMASFDTISVDSAAFDHHHYRDRGNHNNGSNGSVMATQGFSAARYPQEQYVDERQLEVRAGNGNRSNHHHSRRFSSQQVDEGVDGLGHSWRHVDGANRGKLTDGRYYAGEVRSNGSGTHFPGVATTDACVDDVGSGRYTSPTETALSSPPTSPPYDARRHRTAGGRAVRVAGPVNATARTSLAESMERASAAEAAASKPPKSSSSSFSRFFSSSKSSNKHSR